MNTFWMDMRKFEIDADTITGGELKQLANSNPLNPVFQDMFRKGADVPIGDSEKISISGGIKHFYCVIPATMRKGLP